MKADWLTAHQYAEAMKTGAKFPPIDVTKFNGKWIVIDGWHRVDAYKRNGEKDVLANIINLKDEKEIYLEAVKRNARHGRQFSVQERITICLRLQDLKIERATIANLVGIPIDKWERIVGGKVTSTYNGEEVVLKAPLSNLAGMTVPERTIQAQENLSSMSQLQILDNMIIMLENSFFNFSDKNVEEKLRRIKSLLDEIKFDV